VSRVFLLDHFPNLSVLDYIVKASSPAFGFAGQAQHAICSRVLPITICSKYAERSHFKVIEIIPYQSSNRWSNIILIIEFWTIFTAW